MCYAAPGTVSIEILQACRARRNAACRLALTNISDATALHASRFISTHRVHRTPQEFGMRRETDWMTPRHDPAEIRLALRNEPKFGRI